jgi:hypothetical protein
MCRNLKLQVGLSWTVFVGLRIEISGNDLGKGEIMLGVRHKTKNLMALLMKARGSYNIGKHSLTKHY